MMASFFSSVSDSESFDNPVDTNFTPHSSKRKSQPINRRFFENPEDHPIKIINQGLNDSSSSKKTTQLKELSAKKKIKSTNPKRESSSLQHPKMPKTIPINAKSMSHRHFTNRELMEPFAPIKTYPLPDALKKLPVEENGETFDGQIEEKLELYFKELTDLPSAEKLEELAVANFEKTISKETREIKNISITELIFSERQRAIKALTAMQKSAFLIKAYTERLKLLQNLLISLLKEAVRTSQWCNHFFCNLGKLISTYDSKKEIINPLKAFVYSFELLDLKIKELTIKSFKLDKQEFISVFNVFQKWANLQTAESLREKVRAVDNKTVMDSINYNKQALSKQSHKWYESKITKASLLNISVKEILCSLPLITFFIKDKEISCPHFKHLKLEDQENFLTLLLSEIYSLGEGSSLKTCKNQAYCLLHLDTILKDLEANLSLNEIPWVAIQKQLQPFPAVPFLKFKSDFNPKIHKKLLSNFLLSLSIPALDVLKLSSVHAWDKADHSIRCLFNPLFSENPEKILAVPGKEILSAIHVKNNSYFVLQTNCYPISSSQGLPCATVTFNWKIKLFEGGLKACLTIPKIKFAKNIKEIEKQYILKTINNFTIVDYANSAIQGEPIIISNFIS